MKVGNIYLIGLVGREISQVSLLSQVASLGECDSYVIHVNSGGGSVSEGWAIAAALAQIPGKKIALVEGICASIATVIALSCDEIRIARGGSWMVHEPRWTEGGTATQLLQQAEFLSKKLSEMVALYCAKTKMGEEEMRSLLAKEKYLSATEALAFGFVDAIDERDAKLEAAAVASVNVENLPAPLRALVKGQAMDEKDKEIEALKAEIASLKAQLEKNEPDAKAKAEEGEEAAKAKAKAEEEAAPEKKEPEEDVAKAVAKLVPGLVAEALTVRDAAAKEVADRDALIASRPDLAPALVAQLKTLPLANVKGIIEATPRTTNPLTGALAATAIGGGQPGTQGGDLPSGPTSYSAAPVVSELDRAFGLSKPGAAVTHNPGQTVISVAGHVSAERSKK